MQASKIDAQLHRHDTDFVCANLSCAIEHTHPPTGEAQRQRVHGVWNNQTGKPTDWVRQAIARTVRVLDAVQAGHPQHGWRVPRRASPGDGKVCAW